MASNLTANHMREHLGELMEGGQRGRNFALAVGALAIAPIVVPAIAKAAKPIAKATIKNGICLYEKGKVAAAEAGEVWQDMVAEAKAEAVASPTQPQGQSPASNRVVIE